MAMSEAEVYEKVKEVLENALGVDEDEITPDAKLEGDLGAESIDYLDIQFQIEKTFGIKFDATEMNPQSQLNDPELVEDGKVTDKGLAKLREALPHLDLSGFEDDRSVENLGGYFTVNSLVKFVQSKLA